MTDLMAAATRSSRPTWHLRGRGLADDVFDARLTSITVAQHSGMQSDQLSITLDDRPDLPGRRDRGARSKWTKRNGFSGVVV